MQTAYYIDGYHGGVWGHMPLGAWRDILKGLRNCPDWKISIEIEPVSWRVIRRRDPASYDALLALASDPTPEARVEVVGASMAQPYCWAVSGESNIRHLTRGMEILRRDLPGVQVRSYAVQEPCFTSALPQILRSLGFTCASLKNNTVFGGYCAPRDASVVRWVGPDGSSLPAIPRYSFDTRINMWDIQSRVVNPEYMRQAAEAGITHPTGFFFQDCGWPGKPEQEAEYIRYTTLREFFSGIAPEPSLDWHYTPEDMEVTLPWGDKTLANLARHVRSAELRLLTAEKMAAMARVRAAAEWPGEHITEAWNQLLRAQHHDGWIVCTTRPERMNWGWQVDAETWIAEEICDEAIAEAADRIGQAMLESKAPNQDDRTWFMVCNTLGVDRTTTVRLDMAVEPDVVALRLRDAQGNEIPCQAVDARMEESLDHLRRYVRSPRFQEFFHLAPQSFHRAALVLFPASLPAMGTRFFSVEKIRKGQEGITAPTSGAGAHFTEEGDLILHTDLYRVEVDAKRGGIIRSLRCLLSGEEIVASGEPRLFNELRGFFVNEGAWFSSAEHPAEITILEPGPNRIRALIQGRIGTTPCSIFLTLAQSDPAIDFRVFLDFQGGTRIGDPSAQDEQGSSFRQSHYNERFKLQAHFPTPRRQPAIFKDAPFDVCRSRHGDTFFENLNDAKHCVISHWVDQYDEATDRGLAILSDRTTSYAHGPDHPLSLILAWGGRGFQWWGDATLDRTQRIRYAIVPHAGRWDAAGLSAISASWNEPPVSQVLRNAPDLGIEGESLIRPDNPRIEVSTMMVEGNHLLVRLFNMGPEAASGSIAIGFETDGAELVELDGRLRETLEVRDRTVRVEMPPFGLRTMRLAVR